MLRQRLGDTNAAQRAGARAAALPLDTPDIDPFGADASERNDPRDLSDRAQRWLMAGKPAEAAPIIDQVVREHPGFAEGWLLLGRRQLLGQEAVAAERSIRRHLEMDPQSVNGLFQLGMALLAQQKNPDAAQAFERAIRLKPDFGPAFYNLGLARARSGQKREAVPAFRAAIRHNPERIDSYLLLADLHLQLGEKAAAVELAREAEALNPADRRLPTLREKISQAER
jgi:cytochrome c-type biogenesis protein CcmH/NrfG